MSYKKLIYVFVLLLTVLTTFYSGISVLALPDDVRNPFRNSTQYDSCTKAIVSKNGKTATWTCQGNSLFSSDQLSNGYFSNLKKNVNTRAGEMGYKKGMTPLKINFTYKNGYLYYSGYLSGNFLVGVSDIENTDFDSFVLKVTYRKNNTLDQLGPNVCAIENLDSYFNSATDPGMPFAKKISGKVKMNISAEELKRLKTNPKKLLLFNYTDLNQEDKDQLERCNQQFLNAVKSDNLKLKVIYNKDKYLIKGYANVGGFYIDLGRVKFSQAAQENWDKTVKNYNDGDNLEVEGDFSPLTDTYTLGGLKVSFINLDYITSITKIGNDNASKINFASKIYMDLAQSQTYFDGYDTSTITDYLQNITVIALDSNGGKYTAVTNKDGYFQFYDLPIGKYRFKVDPPTIKAKYKNKFLDSGLGDVNSMNKDMFFNGSNQSIEFIPMFGLVELTRDSF